MGRMDGYVSVRLAAEGLKRSVQTIRTWIRNDVVRYIRDERGGILVHGGDVVQAHTTRQSRQRRSTTSPP